MKPEKAKHGITFFPIPEFSGVEYAFGANGSAFFCRNNLPDVPKKFEDMANKLMFKGGKLEGLSDKVDMQKAVAAVSAWLQSFEPAHEAKITTVAYALWLWSDDAALSA